MKSFIILGYLACILSVSFADSDVTSSAQQSANGFNSLPGSLASNCYELLNVNIESMMGVYRAYAGTCIIDANTKRDNSDGGLRPQVDAIVGKVSSYLADCSKQKGFYFYSCLAGHVDFNLDNMLRIKSIATNNAANSMEQAKSIDIEERNCVTDAVDYYRSESQRLINIFGECLATAFAI